MEILSLTYYESLKRYWRKRKYQRIYGARTHGKRKIQVIRLGADASSSPSRFWRIRRIPKLRWKIVSPIKIFSKFHDAYVGMMICLADKMANSNNGGFLGRKKVTKNQQISLVSSGEEVDSRLVLEIYRKLAASRQLRTEL